ncbi:DUF29 domain-containing protein [Paracraurococcus lichenis]|uniref:DUF29 domain-containing protein n=1 Tax=Paracraurococcus lichenis TaxID=3064888 RepID=A0ABT9DYI9_9PROT|nr:DUF29 domain-containing protein [Paracraurococcus sp. LOR1-02]MDO9708959.1 DUF29 domain-containing protein [Paracraurococcus sp. LOR1-02]
MDGSLHDRDFYAWTRDQAAALRRLAETHANLAEGLDLPNLIEEVEDLGSEQVHKVESNLRRLLQHLIYVAMQPEARAVRHWRGEILAFRHNAASRYLASMRREVEPRLDRTWLAARRIAAEKLGRPLPGLPDACPFTLDALLDEDAPLDALLARLTPEPRDHA